jgi:hypothetical protein
MDLKCDPQATPARTQQPWNEAEPDLDMGQRANKAKQLAMNPRADMGSVGVEL